MLGDKVSLRPLIKEDSEHYFRWINNKPLVLLNSAYKPVSRAEHNEWFASVNSRPDMTIFSIIEKNGQLIGSCSLRNINRLQGDAELQIRIGEEQYHSQGYGTEAIKLLVQYGFGELLLNRIYLHVFSTNIRAVKAYEKCGFQLENTLKKAVIIENSVLDVHVMSIFNVKE